MLFILVSLYFTLLLLYSISSIKCWEILK
jgi:hypothetical protein